MDLVFGVFFPDCVLAPPELFFHKSGSNELCYCQGYHLAVWQWPRSNKWSQRGKAHLKKAEGRLVQKFCQQHPSAISSLSYVFIIFFGVMFALCFQETDCSDF